MAAIGVKRGFRRLGAVIAIPALAIALCLGAVAGVSRIRNPPAGGPWAAFEPVNVCQAIEDVQRKAKCQLEYLKALEDYERDHRAQAARSLEELLIVVGGIAALVGVGWFLFCWATGWVIAGFARE